MSLQCSGTESVPVDLVPGKDRGILISNKEVIAGLKERQGNKSITAKWLMTLNGVMITKKRRGALKDQ